ncbi:uncharacterized protein LOC132649528 isoform X2 [Meriones unguiculatus]|uniref:uncharacterized protein LOC132649528 isoform X2 n=1 Tax=Meriones unguiculatus TaxID=10047 RepID=UPI00293EFF46|nr:uncharacterized protein LOC132649528 isoform X2 [Meriones unguiculatus]
MQRDTAPWEPVNPALGRQRPAALSVSEPRDRRGHAEKPKQNVDACSATELRLGFGAHGHHPNHHRPTSTAFAKNRLERAVRGGPPGTATEPRPLVPSASAGSGLRPRAQPAEVTASSVRQALGGVESGTAGGYLLAVRRSFRGRVVLPSLPSITIL